MNKSVESLAVFGGKPLFSQPRYVGRPNIGDKEAVLRNIESILDSRFLTNDGPNVQRFEKAVEEYVGVKHCIACCNGTVALELAVRALGLSGEVIVPSMTFIATAHSLQWQGITPVFVDIDPSTNTLDPKLIQQHITESTSGIIGVHLWGHGCDIRGLEEVAEKNNLKLMFDAAHAFGCSYRGKKIGGFGDAEVFSFHATKFFNTFEGGAVVTNDDELAEKLRLMRNFGFNGVDNVEYIGTNGKMTEVCAAMGLASFESVDDFIDCNTERYRAYQRGVSEVPYLRLIPYDEAEQNNFQYIILELDPASPISRDHIVDMLWKENVIARKYFYPGCHRMEPYRSDWKYKQMLLPETERLCDRVIALPTGTAMSIQDVEDVCACIGSIIENGVDISARINQFRDAS